MVINRTQQGTFVYYECTFLGGNLFAFSIVELIEQLQSIYGFSCELFNYSLN